MSQLRTFKLTRAAIILAIFAALLFVMGGLPGSAAAAPTCTTDCYVDPAGNDANDGTLASPLLTIQAAVNQVAPNGTVHVAAGTYVEQIQVTKSLALEGAGAGLTIIKAPASIPVAADPNSIIVKISGAGVNAEISGFTVSGPGPGGCGTIGYGIFVQGNAYADIHDNEVIDIKDTGLSGCQNGIGIRVGSQFLTSFGTADITNNIVATYQKGGIVVDGLTSHAVVTGNTVLGDGPIAYIAENGIQISRGATAVLSGNVVTGHKYTGTGWASTGILLYEAGFVDINGNTVGSNDVGIDVYASTTIPTINLNQIFGNAWGLYNEMTTPINALYNWWGDASGPSGEGPGTGDWVGEYVLFDPFLTSAALPAVTLTPPTGPVCNTGTVGIAFANMPAIYGYEFKVEFNDDKVSAVSAFDNSWFVTTGQYIPWQAGTCTGSECKLAVTKQGSAPVSGGGTVATVNLTAVSGGLTPIKIKEVVVSDIDGFRIPVSVANDTIEIGVCGTASVSGKISLQGRLTPMDAGSVKLVDTGAHFPEITVAFDANGNFSIPNVPVLPTGSTYSIRALHGLYLDNLKTLAPMLPGDSLTGENTRLLGGDADNSALIDISDLTCMGGWFGLSSPNFGICGTTGSPDINKDLKVNIQDLSIAGGNYMKASPQNW
jgi:parallel beta-helix repeat protein